jgi:hypothetical protein
MGAILRRRDVIDEFRGATFGDRRLSKRLERIAGLVAAVPSASLPVANRNDSELEATYRFLSNDRVTAEEILQPHRRATIKRCGETSLVVVAHDTTEFNFGRSSREDLGRVGRGKSHGFYAHIALAVDMATDRQPLGVLGIEIHARNGGKGRRGHRALQAASDNESRRWVTSFDRVHDTLGERALHTMDREGDSYALLAHMLEREGRFVVRMAGMKRKVVHDEHNTVGDVVASGAILAERDVPVTAHGESHLPSNRRLHPPRRARIAKLSITASSVVVKRPVSSSQRTEATLSLHVVHVIEKNPPTGEKPIEWRLWTSEPIDTDEAVLAVVDAYRCRWVIEEYFKALKTGCAIESRQIESHDGLVNTLALYAPIAWRLLRMRHLSRDNRPTPAIAVLSEVQLKCLAAGLKKLKRTPLPARPTTRDALLGVAGLGGHIKNNGDPGWQVLGRGMDRLLLIELGYRARDEM